MNNGIKELLCNDSMSLQKKKWEAISHYNKLTSYIVSKNGTKEDKGGCYVAAVVSEKARLGTKQC